MASKQKKRFKNNPKYVRVRENAAEFGHSGETGKMLFDSARAMSHIANDKETFSRVVEVMKKVINADRLSDRGMRTITSGGIPLLRGFNFNKGAKLSSILFAPFSAVIDRAAGTATINIPDFIPERMMKRPLGATHVTILSGVAEIDFVTGAKTVNTLESQELALGMATVPAITLSNAFAAGTTRPVFLFLGLRFSIDTNDKDYELKTQSFNALSIVEISTAA
ncbi:hypothetical protein F0L74_21530 [Chitinophaga agrisoli]|uniref:Uncharacterized protein n=1 Tax=Chitinophaga agrisoli TaxID=2607653 RepID=A0A5B2VJD7_9BACT|nr:hypothetical protein [Chitinophaga agrisoli]KAA2238798.1 hypothetical protein F0L74_21530 [Chitinophaga agrisoli]